MKERVEKLNIRKTITKLLSSVSHKNREVLERRFGIARSEPETLESIGKSYKITRERVRQIQEYAIKKLMSGGGSTLLAPVFDKIAGYINIRGGVAKESDIFESLVRSADSAYLAFALRLMPGLIVSKETDDLHTRCAINESVLLDTDGIVAKVHNALSIKGMPLSFLELTALAQAEGQNFFNKYNTSPQNILALSKRIKQGPFGDHGLAEWSRIAPRGVKDKAHIVFEREKKPLHFREISTLIDKYFAAGYAGPGARATNPQTVHNELIKDPRFVLIGRGLYALADWGYEPGTVKDVLVQILRNAGQPLPKEEVLNLISERRFVKPNTVFLNLQNKNYFKKLEDGKYYLA